LAADARGGTPQAAGNAPKGQPGTQSAGDLLSLRQAQHPLMTASLTGRAAAAYRDARVERAVRLLQPSRSLDQTLVRFITTPKLRFLLRRQPLAAHCRTPCQDGVASTG